tara:strand:- start:567 stop:839 length:273 start_codon:yes stop_codon:yes gene_type:complete
MSEAYKLSIVIVSDSADPSRLLEAIQEAGERIADECYGECPEMDGANGMVQCLDYEPERNTITLGSTRLARLQRERDELLQTIKRIEGGA